MVLGGSFVVAIAIAFLLVRRTKRVALWVGLAAVLFCAVAGIARLVGDPRNEATAARLYNQGEISWNDYRAAVEADHRAQDIDGIAGVLAVLFCFGIGSLARRSGST